MFISATAFLPSSFGMACTAYAYGRWFSGRDDQAVLGLAVASIVAWPFCGALGLPIFIDLVLLRGRFLRFLRAGFLAVLIILVPLVVVDSYYYRRLVVAPLNIVLYNVLSTNTSSQLYGTEPWHFYLRNGILNLNFVLPLALTAPLLVFLRAPGPSRASLQRLATCAPLLWLAIFTAQPHKEERFLFPAYPLFCVTAAAALETLLGAVCGGGPFRRRARVWLRYATVAVVMALSLSRALALYRGYHAPLEVYGQLGMGALEARFPTRTHDRVRVCIGKEWYRFPSAFFLPSGRYEARFLRSEFTGQLPSRFARTNGTHAIPPHMNDMNREEVSRYVEADSCHAIVDLDVAKPAPKEPAYTRDPEKWERVHCAQFLDPAASHPLFRAFYVPKLGSGRVALRDYCLLARKKRHSRPRRPRRAGTAGSKDIEAGVGAGAEGIGAR
eukprot:UC1_evm1s2099